MLLIFVTNDWLNDKEILYHEENNVCRIQSTQRSRYLYLYFLVVITPHWMLGNWKGFKNHTRITMCIRTHLPLITCFTTRNYNWWNNADMGRCRRFIRTMVIFSTALRLLFPNLIYWESSFYRAYIFNIFLSIIMKSRAGLMPALQKWKFT